MWLWSAIAVAGVAQTPEHVETNFDSVYHFFEALDAHDQGTPLRRALRQHYLRPDTPAQRHFLRYADAKRAGKLAYCVTKLRPLYDVLAERMPEVERQMNDVRVSLTALETDYPEAEYPEIHFHVGCFASAGTASDHGLHVGLEHFTRPEALNPEDWSPWLVFALHPTDRLERIVVHELTHFQQDMPSDTLLEHALVEGGADFVSELYAGGPVTSNHDFGMAHEAEIWRAFSAQRHHAPLKGNWFYEETKNGWPRDLGYFVGYRIAEAYYEQADDKHQALYTLLHAEDADALLDVSGYGAAFLVSSD